MPRKPIPTSDSHAGYHRFRDEEGKPIDGTSCWITWRDAGDVHPSEFGVMDFDEVEPGFEPAGWYYAPCYPGCLPDSDFTGPFTTSRNAYKDAMS